MSTQKYKCIAQPESKGLKFTIGKEYEINAYYSGINRYGVFSDDGYIFGFNADELLKIFQKVEPTKTQPMKYKVTITSTDLTGHEDEKEVYENQTEFDVCRLIEEMAGSRFLIEPQPEKQKVTVWFYVVEFSTNSFISSSSLTKETTIDGRNLDIKKGRKVSEIKSMEVEL
jgi:hypothetical protein